MEQLDVNNVFLHGELNEEVYMLPPPGAILSRPNVQSHADHSLLIKSEGDSFTALLIYVDDIVVAGNDKTKIDSVKRSLDSEFKIKDLGNLHYFLGLEILRSVDGLLISQRKYALELISDGGMLGAKPCSTPLEPGLKLEQDAGHPYEDVASYHRLIGRLLYLTTTRPDICHAVQQLSQFISKPTDIHMNAALHVLRYLKNAPSNGLFYPAANKLQPSGFADSDWAVCADTRRSITGFCVFIGSALVSWESKKQGTVSRSSSEAEYRSLAALTCKIQWIRYLLQDLQVPFHKAVPIYCDNRSAIYLAHNPTFHERTKHIEIDCHLIREKILDGLVHFLPIASGDQLADPFTKSLSVGPFKSLVGKLGLRNTHPPT
ncbi:uncharacterized mitochondrial protein AtMg00810-like [Gastrolobium bilobum]|uniref:uncharacterized mitochondrial protein AtMg00810-like n=1 Tax=Gastrolobium bilobum TaxID=150636 RepID=UPI002AB1DB88|nr:uncharacterized mitochondrial protein AtMg00810-like [Gastrolobium bilobum]